MTTVDGREKASGRTAGGSAGSGKRGASYNLNGQRLGRKGRVTRERIIAAALVLLDGPRDNPITLSAVAREASLGMSSIYQYFGNLTELLLAVLEPVMATAEEAYIAPIRQRWTEEELHERCHEFVEAYYRFWERHARILHQRNAMADQQDKDMILHRVSSATPVIKLLVTQMDNDPEVMGTPAYGMATVLYTGIERVVTVATDLEFQRVVPGAFRTQVEDYIAAEARLLELGIREHRTLKAAAQA